ncbi:MAG: hypothetical protein PHQ96_06030 [Candidatus Omnitrophica bacterium]|nr:hypothetical protein [Candidatus Omnitrophota bacterium]
MDYSAVNFLGAYIGVISFMATLLVMVAASIGVTFIESQRANLNKAALWIFRALCWLAFIIAAIYALLSIYNLLFQLIAKLLKKA